MYEDTGFVGITNVVEFQSGVDEPVDIDRMYRNSIDSSPDNLDSVLADSDRLNAMVGIFFDRLNIPARLQLPILDVMHVDGKKQLVMKGLLFSEAMRIAIMKVGPEVKIVRPSKSFLDEIHVDIEFFARMASGEADMVLSEISSRAGSVIEA